VDGAKMNANELADLIDNEDTLWLEGRLSEIATMLRQQQSEIGFYKQDADKYKQKCESQQAEIEALKMMLVNRNDIIDRLDLK
jgi:hypothetical protein